MGLLTKVESWLAGKKVYIVSIVTGGLGIWVAMGHIVPDYVWAILGAMGLGAVRSTLSTIQSNQTPPAGK